MPEPALTELMSNLDPNTACRRLVVLDEELDAVMAETDGVARAELVRGVLALLRPRYDQSGAVSLDDVDPEIAVQVLVARAQVAGRVW